MTAPAITAPAVDTSHYQRRLAAMTDAQLRVEAARIEALPGGTYRHLVDEEAEAHIAEQHAKAVAR